MENLKRRRGRPVGTQIRDDKALALVADKIVADPELTPSTAMRQVCSGSKWQGSSTDTIVARWLRKWRTTGRAALEAAQQRREERMRRVPIRDIQWPYTTLAVSDELKAALIGMTRFQEPARQAMAEIAKLQEPVRQAAAELAKSLAPTQKMIEQIRGIATIPKEIGDQMAALATAFKTPEFKALFDQINAPKIPDAILIPPMVTRIH